MPTIESASVAAQSQTNDDSPIEHLEPPAGTRSKSPKGLIFGFAATITIGLALASWYVGVRIVSAHEIPPSSRASALVVTNTAPAEIAAKSAAASPVQATAADEEAMGEAYWSNVPPPVDLFLQVASLGPKQDARFIRLLKARGFRAQVQTRDSDGTRILVGPFPNRGAMEDAQDDLQSAGVLAIEAGY